MGLRSTILTCSLERQPTHRLRYRCLVTGIKANRKGSFSAEVTHGISGTFPDEAIRIPILIVALHLARDQPRPM